MELVDRIYRRCLKPDLPYYDAMDLVHRHLVPRTYVEIGVATGRTLRLALPGTACVGIDPAPRLERPAAAGQQIFAQTSDDFFATHDLGAVLGGAPMDLAFIDGMHHFEFALRDFMNLERASHPDTTVLIHDCLPQSEEGAARERSTVLWSGDVWRLIVALREWRPDLGVAVADWGPTGLGVVRGLDRRSTVLADRYDEIVERLLAMPYRGARRRHHGRAAAPGPRHVGGPARAAARPPVPVGQRRTADGPAAAHEVVPAARRSLEYRREARASLRGHDAGRRLKVAPTGAAGAGATGQVVSKRR